MSYMVTFVHSGKRPELTSLHYVRHIQFTAITYFNRKIQLQLHTENTRLLKTFN